MYKPVSLCAGLASAAYMIFMGAKRENTHICSSVTVGGVVVENSKVFNDISIEYHAKATANYILFSRTTDTFIVRNTGSGVIKGIYTPKHELTYISYYDDLGSIDGKATHKDVYTFRFRYPLKPTKAISFSVETLSGNNFFRTKKGRKLHRDFYSAGKGISAFAGNASIAQAK